MKFIEEYKGQKRQKDISKLLKVIQNHHHDIEQEIKPQSALSSSEARGNI